MFLYSWTSKWNLHNDVCMQITMKVAYNLGIPMYVPVHTYLLAMYMVRERCTGCSNDVYVYYNFESNVCGQKFIDFAIVHA